MGFKRGKVKFHNSSSLPRALPLRILLTLSTRVQVLFSHSCWADFRESIWISCLLFLGLISKRSFFPFFFFFGTQELNSFNYLDLYRLADLFNLTLLEKAVIDFLVKHLSELLKSRPEDILTLPYCLLQEVLKSDRLTSLSEEQIWQVRALCMGPLLAWRHSMIKS